MKPRPSSQVIVDAQELTRFLRQSQEFSGLTSASSATVVELVNDDASTQAAGSKTKPLPRVPRPVSSTLMSNQRRLTTGAKKGWKRHIGIPLAVASGLLLTLGLILVKKLSRKYYPLSIALWQFVVHFLLSIPVLLYFRIWLKVSVFESGWNHGQGSRVNMSLSLRKKGACVVGILISCISGVTVLMLQFMVLKYLQVGDATIIAFSGSLFTIGFGHFFLYEKCGFVTIPVSCFILFGLFLMTRPPFLTGSSEYSVPLLIGVSMALLTTILASAYLIAMRKLRKVHFSFLLLVFGGLGVVQCGIAVGFTDSKMIPDLDWNLVWIVALGSLTFLATAATLGALKYEEAGTVNLTRMMDVLFSFLLQYLFLQDIPDKFSLVGATIILSGVSIIGLRSILLTLPAENHCRRGCCYLLK